MIKLKMDTPRRRSLKGTKQFIIENLYYSDFLKVLDELEQESTLTEDHIQDIKAERTENERIAKFIDILVKRGPDAFQAFIDSLKDAYGFIANEILTELEKELEKSREGEDNRVNQSLTASRETLISLDTVEKLNICSKCIEEISMAYNHSTNHSSAQNPPTTRDESVSTEETNQWTALTRSQTTLQRMNTQHSGFLHGMMQESFTCWYTKLKLLLMSRNMREPSFQSPEPVTFVMVDNLLDQLINEVEKCFRALGAKDRHSLLTHVLSLKDSKKKLKEQLKEAHELKNKYADTLHKQENKNRELNAQIKKKDKELEKLNDDKSILHEIIKNKETKLNQLEEKNEEMKEELATTGQQLREKAEENQILTAQLQPLQEDNAKLAKQLREVNEEMRAYKLSGLKFESQKPTSNGIDSKAPVHNSLTGANNHTRPRRIDRTTKGTPLHHKKGNPNMKSYVCYPQNRNSEQRFSENKPKGLLGFGIKGIGRQ